jgi:antitoxin component HigA of HigAB toxin-antitoxin module
MTPPFHHTPNELALNPGHVRSVFGGLADRAELVDLVGSAGMASKILSRRRRLTLAMARELAAALDVPLEMLTSDYAVEPYESESARA